MKGQIFLLGAISVALALFLLAPGMQKEIFLPKTDTYILENIALEYNYWLSYLSLEDEGDYEPESFGRFVKENYPHLELYYIIYPRGENAIYFANFFDETLIFSLEGQDYPALPNEAQTALKLTGRADISVLGREFSILPKSRFSGAIFISSGSPMAKAEILKIFE